MAERIVLWEYRPFAKDWEDETSDAVGWRDGALDLNRKMAANTPYARWFAGLPHDRQKESTDVQ